MLAIAIKNIIIFVLVMLCFHYALKTYKLEKEGFEAPLDTTTAAELAPLPVAPATCKDRKATSDLDQYFGCKPAPEYKCENKEPIGDGTGAPKPPTFVAMEGEKSAGCDPSRQNGLGGTTCDPGFKPTVPQALPVKSDCVLDQPNPNAFLMLRTYDNDNVINTGHWDNVDLYDEFGEVFAEFSCDAYSG
jgi:hypothetical protein